MLEYENQMLLDLLHEDGLMITAKGLGMERILVSLITTFSDPGNLVVVMGTTPREEEYILAQVENLSPSPRCITAECSVNERSQVYYNGGVLFVTTRILVMDLLMERIPVELITGIIVWKAHRILESCQEAFALRLYRQKNKTGFVKALSSSPLSFTAGFCHVERVMRNLFVKKLYLWPRFHIDINTCLEKFHPEVVELHLTMTHAMKEIQMAMLDLITATVQELKRSNKAIDTDEFTTENAISNAFEKILRVQLDPVWHQLSARTRTLVTDLKLLKTVMSYLTQYDCVTFYNLVNSLKTTEEALKSSGWMLLSSAESLFLNSKLRVFGVETTSDGKKKVSDGRNLKKELNELSMEVNPKWVALSEVLDEIQREEEDSKIMQKCLVVTQDDRTSQQLREYLIHGSQVVLQRLFYKTIGYKMGMCLPESIKTDPRESKSNTSGKQKNNKRGISKTKTHDHEELKDKGMKTKRTKTSDIEEEKELTLTQLTKQYDFIAHSDSDESEFEKASKEEDRLAKRRFISPLTLIQSIKSNNDPFKMTQLLQEVQPKYVIMYDSDLTFIRQLEVWQANHVERVRVYVLLYKGTTEEQVYLTNVKREKEAFEYLIKEKTSMVVPEYNDGKSDDHPDLIRGSRRAAEEEVKNTRKGGLMVEEASVPQERIIVDMREFRSELPALIHKRGIDIDPVTIEVGDYILSPEICVERKSLSDLISSLNSGRLYNQAQAMTRCYKRPVLLIEFDQNKPFYLQGRYFLSSDSSSSSKDVAAKLQLLTLHFPHLRILWCSSPYATAEIFHMLKIDREQPMVSQAEAVTTENDSEIVTERYNAQIKDFISKLPGINTSNIYALLNKVTSLPELMTLSKEKLTEILGGSSNAEALHSSLHQCLKPPEQSKEARRGGKFTKKGRRRFQIRPT